jgi:hypothetical protein
MRRARVDEGEEPQVKKKQATLGAFFRRVDGQPLSDPVLVKFYLPCPHCDFRAQSDVSKAPLPGALRAHVHWQHALEHLEASTRLQAAASGRSGPASVHASARATLSAGRTVSAIPPCAALVHLLTLTEILGRKYRIGPLSERPFFGQYVIFAPPLYGQ